jgi:hypothetical protein
MFPLAFCGHVGKGSALLCVTRRKWGWSGMRSKDLRAEVRIPVIQKGTLSSGDTLWFPCLIVDMSDSGILIMSNREIPVGQVLDFRCELFPKQYLECTLEIVHVDDTRLGAKIVDIDAKGISLRKLFLEEQFAHKMDSVRLK